MSKLEIGKVPVDILNRIVLDPINNNINKRKDIVVRPSTGEDCSAVDPGGEICVLSTDPITAAGSNAGYLVVHINCNDAASAGAEPIGMLLTALLPYGSTEEDLKEIVDGAYKAAGEIGIEILGGHTEITEAVNKPVVNGTVIAKTKNRKFISSGGAKTGQHIIMSKWAAIEGTSIIASDYEDKDVYKRQVVMKDKELPTDRVKPEEMAAVKGKATDREKEQEAEITEADPETVETAEDSDIVKPKRCLQEMPKILPEKNNNFNHSKLMKEKLLTPRHNPEE